MINALETIHVRRDGRVLFAQFDSPPMNLIGPEVVRDLVTLLRGVEAGGEVGVIVFESADPEYFFPHVDVTKIAEYTAEAAKAGGPEDASLGMLLHRLSGASVVTIAKVRGRARAAGSEFALACDMCFAASESAIFGQPELGFGLVPGAGGVQHLTRLLGRNRALEAILGADDFDARLAERYGWINRAILDADLDGFVERFARRIGRFPLDALRVAKGAVNDIALAEPAVIRQDAKAFQRLAKTPDAQHRVRQLFSSGLQTRGEFELNLGREVGALVDRPTTPTL